nr:hypothetical protein [Tanacetum cinerariifolium]
MMRIPLLYRGEYSQWSEMFMNYFEEQTDGEAMINSIKNGDQPLPRVTQVSIFGTSSTEQPPLKDKSMCNKTMKDLWDALARQMLGSEYGKQDRKAAVLCEYETFKATERELLLDTYIRYLHYATMMRHNKNLMDINIDSLYNILKQNQGDVNNAMGLKKKTFVVTYDPVALIAKKTKKEGYFAKDFKKVKVKDFQYYKTKMLLAKQDKDEQVLLAEDHAWMESNSDSDQEINANMVFMEQMKKVLSDSEKSSSSSNEIIIEVSYYTFESESEYEFKTSEYYDNSTNYGLFVDNGDDQESFHDSSETFSENHIGSQMDYDQSAVDHNDSEEKIKLIN